MKKVFGFTLMASVLPVFAHPGHEHGNWASVINHSATALIVGLIAVVAIVVVKKIKSDK